MKRLVPLLITAIGGFVLIVAFFIPAWQGAGEVVAVWFDILASIAFILGGGNLLKVHLKKISDRSAGWGYSGITLLAFLITLWVGMFKVGVGPSANTEFYGETFASVPLEEMPEFSVPGRIPTRGDGGQLPASVRNQIRQDGDQIRFRGWMTSAQAGDLDSYQDLLQWQADIEALAELAVPPESLRGKVTYHADHRVLGFKGVMSDADKAALKSAFADKSATLQAIDHLFDESQRKTEVEVAALPTGFTVPESASERVSLAGTTLSIQGPMSAGLRDQIASEWPSYPRLRPMSAAEVATVNADLAAAGKELTPEQSAAIDTAADSIWDADVLIQTLESAGIPSPGRKTARQLLAEREAGETNLDQAIPAGPAVTLTDDHKTAIRAFADDSLQTHEDLITALNVGGPLTAGQLAALDHFLDSQPTLGQWKRELAFTLLKLNGEETAPGPSLTKAQLDLLLTDAELEYKWRNEVHHLFELSNPVKYSWSGEYQAAGSGLSWIYEYLFQPLTATMFAMLAFYVASAAFRAFRAKNIEAILLLGTAFIILVAQTPIGAVTTSWIPDEFAAFRADEMKRYIMSLFNTAGNRAIMIGIALGIAATSLKILLGVDRSYLGSGDD